MENPYSTTPDGEKEKTRRDDRRRDEDRGAVGSLEDIMKNFANPSRMTPDGNEFVKKLTESIQVRRSDIKMVPLTTDKIEAIAFTSATNAVLLLFTDAAAPGEYPLAGYRGEVECLLPEDLVVLQCNVIRPEDYPRLTAWVTHVRHLFEMAENTNNVINVHHLIDGYDFFIDTNIRAVRDDFSVGWPHAVLPRMDFGFTVCVSKHRTRGDREDRRRGRDDAKPFVSVACYVEFVEMETSGRRRRDEEEEQDDLMAFVHISGIYAQVPTPTAAALVQPLVADLCVNQDLWKSHLTSFAKDAPNLGSLEVVDDTGALSFFTSDEEVNRFIARNIPTPYIVMDVVEGQAGPLGYTDWAFDRDAVVDDIENLFDENIFVDGKKNPYTPEISDGEWDEYVGVIDNRDSRSEDYLNLAIRTDDLDILGRFLRRDPNPEIRNEDILSIHPTFAPDMVSTCVVLNTDTINDINEELVAVGFVYDTNWKAPQRHQSLRGVNFGKNRLGSLKTRRQRRGDGRRSFSDYRSGYTRSRRGGRR